MCPDGTIFFGAPDKELYAYGSDTTFMWSTEFQGSITAAPVVGPGQVLAVSSAGDLRSLDSVTGTLQVPLSSSTFFHVFSFHFLLTSCACVSPLPSLAILLSVGVVLVPWRHHGVAGAG